MASSSSLVNANTNADDAYANAILCNTIQYNTRQDKTRQDNKCHTTILYNFNDVNERKEESEKLRKYVCK